MTYILDLDHTLLDTNAFKRALEASLAPLGVSREQFQETYAATVSAVEGHYDYTIAGHAKQLASVCHIEESEAMTNLAGALDQLPRFLYPDSLPFLTAIQTRGLPCVLLTFGNALFQEEKVRRLGIAHFFDKLIFTEERKDRISFSFSDDEREWVFVNDNPIEIHALAERFPQARMIRIQRPGAKTFSVEADVLELVKYSSLSEVEVLLIK